jgi:hypothetical protein
VRYESRAIVAESGGKVFGIGDAAETDKRRKEKCAGLKPRFYKELREDLKQAVRG